MRKSAPGLGPLGGRAFVRRQGPRGGRGFGPRPYPRATPPRAPGGGGGGGCWTRATRPHGARGIELT